MLEAPASPVSTDPDADPTAPHQAQLQLWLVLLCCVAALASVRALLLPPWPRAQPLPQQRLEALLRQAALQPRRLPSESPHRSQGLALSPGLVWRLPAGSELRLASVSVRRWEDVQVAWITRGLPRLSLQQRRLDLPQAGMASGRLQGRTAFQTCLVPQGSSPASPVVTLSAFQQAVDRLPRSHADQLATILGLRRTRQLDCLLVTLQSPTTQPPSLQTWQKLLGALQGFAVVSKRP